MISFLNIMNFFLEVSEIQASLTLKSLFDVNKTLFMDSALIFFISFYARIPAMQKCSVQIYFMLIPFFDMLRILHSDKVLRAKKN